MSLKRMPFQYPRAHAALSPWQGQNALDAAVAAYTNVSLLRQQVKPSHRIHGVFEGKDWAANGEYLLVFFVQNLFQVHLIRIPVIPDNAKML
jgi:hypothetical protein